MSEGCKRWKVGELAKATGLTVRALHHYDEVGLLVPSERTSAGHRLYAERDVRRLYRILALRSLGLGLEEIACSLDKGPPALAETVRRQLRRVERELDQRQQLRGRLTVILDALERPIEPSLDQFIDAIEVMTMIEANGVDATELARMLGVSRQRATELAESAPDFPTPTAGREERPLWARRQVEGWAASHPGRGPGWSRPLTSRRGMPAASLFRIMELAGKHSGELDHGWVGDEHLLLALLDADCPGVARQALESFDLSLERVQRAVIDSVGPSPDAGWKSFSPDTQYVLERANLKAVELRDELVSGEHALLALLEAPAESRGLALLVDHAIDSAALAQHVIALTDRHATGSAAGAGVPPSAGEVDAAAVARILALSRTRVVELAASAPDFPSSELGPDGYRVWSRAAVEAWAAAHPDRAPRPSKLSPPAPGTVGHGTDHILELAKAEARELNHSCVYPDHLFLALLRRECPGEARATLASLGLTLEEARRRHVESRGDPYEPHDRELTIPPATHLVLEQATLAALELEDEYVSGVHVLLALIQHDRLPKGMALPEVSLTTLHERLMAETDGMLPASAPPSGPGPQESATRIPRPPDPELAPSPTGHDPRRRKPWGGAGFSVAGKALLPRQYFLDRDGHPMLTTDGQPVFSLQDEQGKDVLDEAGKGILTPVEIPEGSEVRSYSRDP